MPTFDRYIKNYLQRKAPEAFDLIQPGATIVRDTAHLKAAIDAAVLAADPAQPQTIVLCRDVLPPLYETDNGSPEVCQTWDVTMPYSVGDYARDASTGICYKALVTHNYTWDATLTYAEDDTVRNGSPAHTYRAKQAVPINTATSNTTYWEDLGTSPAINSSVTQWVVSTPGIPLSEYNISIQYAAGAWELPLPGELPAQLSKDKAIVVLFCDDGRADWLDVDDATSGTGKFGGTTLHYFAHAAYACAPAFYAARHGVPFTLAFPAHLIDDGTGLSGGVATMLPPELSECVLRAGFEIASHSYSHDKFALPHLSAANLWRELFQSKRVLDGVKIGNGQALTQIGSSEGQWFQLVVPGYVDPDDVVMTDHFQHGLFSAADIQAALTSALSQAGWPEGPDTVVRVFGSASDIAYIQGYLICIGRGDGPNTPSVSIGAGSTSSYALTTLGEFSLGPIRGFVLPGTWPTNESILGRMSTQNNVIARMLKRCYKWVRGVYGRSPAKLTSTDVVASKFIDLTIAGAATDIAALGTSTYPLLPGYVYPIAVHALAKTGGGYFKALIDRLQTLVNAGTIQVVTMSTAMNHVLVDDADTMIPGGDIATLDISTVNGNGLIKLDNTARFSKAKDDASAWASTADGTCWMRFTPDASGVLTVWAFNMLPGRTYKLSVKVRNNILAYAGGTSYLIGQRCSYGSPLHVWTAKTNNQGVTPVAGNDWTDEGPLGNGLQLGPQLQHYPVASTRADYSPITLTRVPSSSDGVTHPQAKDACLRDYPVGGATGVEELCVYVPSDFGPETACAISISKHRAYDDIQITAIRFGLG